MEKLKLKPEFRPTAFKDRAGRYVQVVFYGAPPLQLGGFKTENEAKDWVKHNSAHWLDTHSRDGRKRINIPNATPRLATHRDFAVIFSH
jgi:hypothetical protein